MSAEDGLLAAIMAAPDDDAPRLAYADWLTQQGGPQGELIRVQIELTHLPPDHVRHAALKFREEQLLAAPQPLLGPLAPLGLDIRFERGLVSSVTTTASRLLACAAELFRAAPVQELCLKAAAGLLPQLAARPELAGIRRLFLTFSDLTAPDVQALAQSPHLGRLVTLNLARNAIGDDGLRALVTSAACPRLADLWLAHNSIGDDGLIALAGAPLLGQLRTLRLNGNPIGDRGIQALATSPHAAGLYGLHLGATRCTDAGALALAGSRHLGALRWLVAKKCPLGAAGENALRERLGGGFNREVLS